MGPLAWAVILLVLGLCLVIAEVFVPSGGLLGVLSVTSIVSSVVIAYGYGGVTIGSSFLAVTLLALPAVIAVAFRILPRTAIGRQLIAQVPSSQDVLPDNAELRNLKSLLGKLGVSKSMMLPSGAVQIEGKIVDAFSEGLPIEPNTTIRVIAVRGNRVLVRPYSGDPTQPPPAAADDILAQPFDGLGFDPFDEEPR